MNLGYLPQIKQWKRRSSFLDPVSEVRFEYRGLDLQRSNVFGEKPKGTERGA